VPEKTIEIDPSAGFCFGVEQAIAEAEKLLASGKKVSGLGHMVHNEEEIARLEGLGLDTVCHQDLSTLKPGKLILRAHGEPPETYQLAMKKGIQIVDATCPIVKKLQDRIRKCHEHLDSRSQQLVLFGKSDHPETIGLLGQTGGDAILLTDPEDLSGLDQDKDVFLFSQTTMDPDDFEQLSDNIACLIGDRLFESNNTICGQMKSRKPKLKKFASGKDLLFFVSGKKSSNGAMLYRYCKEINPNTFWIHSASDIDPDSFGGAKHIGISGATSTPSWQLEEIASHISSLLKA